MSLKFRPAIIAFCLILSILSSYAQPAVYPTHWFAGMQWNKLQLLVHEKNIGEYAQGKVNYPGVTLAGITTAESPNYLFINLTISPRVLPGQFSIELKGKSGSKLIQYELKKRRPENGTAFATGVTSEDLIYLVMPDRFANGDASNDVIKTYKDQLCNRKDPNMRHGGDLQGVEDKLNYISDLGATAIWMCPVLENDMPVQQEAAGPISGYHGYWITNHYEVDKRLGGNEAYKKLVTSAHNQGLKIIQDAVYNHVGNEHFLFRDQPFADMFNHWPNYTGSNHREEAIVSPYASEADKKVMLDGWFVPHLPDLNLANPYMANFIIQNTLWCTEEFGIDGWRVDTYKYCYEPFLNHINDAILADFPQISIFGEAWAKTVPTTAYFTQNNMDVPFKHNCPGVTDFPVQSAILSAITQPYGWESGVNKLMMTLSLDFLYKDAFTNCIFLDNHDMDRFGSMIANDLQKYTMGIGLLLTLRGIPQLYYGTELFLRNDEVNGDGKKRQDFPGGFKGDAVNKFNAAAFKGNELAAFTFIKKLANFRKTSKALQIGSTTNYLPKDGVFAFSRTHGDETVFIVVNQQAERKTITAADYGDALRRYMVATNVITGKSSDAGGDYVLEPMSVNIFSFK